MLYYFQCPNLKNILNRLPKKNSAKKKRPTKPKNIPKVHISTSNKFTNMGIGFGIPFGFLFGTMLDNLSLGLVIGVALGFVIGFSLDHKNS